MTEFNPKKHYLGTLCKKGHEYEHTEESLRYKSDGRCVLCKLLHGREFRRRKKARGELSWHQKNPEKKRKCDAQWRTENTEKYRTINNRNHKKAVKNLTDTYVKRLIVSQGSFKSREDVPQRVVEAKRESVLLNRKIKETEKLIKEKENDRI